jgi:serine/threonine protein kinase
VAIKILIHGAGADLRTRFDREAQAVAQVEHPHVCRVYDVGSDQGIDYLVMEYLQGETLAQRLTRGPLPADEAIAIAVEIADALVHTHQHGLVHRDLKPGNVMLTANGVKVLDFGLSKWLVGSGPNMPPSSLTGAGAVGGTLAYMSPEQVDGKPADARSDVFALGTIVYEMLAGQPAFSRETPSSTVAAILHGEPAPLRERAPALSPALATFVATCLAKQPENRWQSAAEAGAALRRIQQHPDERVRGTLRGYRRKRFAALAAALVLAVITAAGWLVVRNRADADTTGTAASGETLRRSIAVLGFRNLSGRADIAWLSPAFAEMLTTVLTAGDGVRAISGENVARM